MVKILVIIINLAIFSQASNFTDKCLKCHEQQNIPFEMIYKRYLIKYSSSIAIKEAMIKMCKNPSLENSELPRGFLRRFGVKDTCSLKEKDLNQAIDELIEYYDIKKYIKIKYFDKEF